MFDNDPQLRQIWDLLVSTLINRLESGEATAQDLNIARQVLKDHGFNVDTTEDTPITPLNESLPFPSKKPDNKEALG